MKLYKISQTQNNDYDTYDSAVVSAEDEEDARSMHPGWTTDKEWREEAGVRHNLTSNTWVNYNDRCVVVVEYLGDTEIGKGIVVASFNAG